MHRIYARFGSKKERDFMRDFLGQQDFSLWQHSEAGDFVLQTGEQMGLSPRAGGLILGFEGDTLPQKTWALMAWVALRSSIRENDWAVIQMDEEEIPVVVGDKSTDEDALFVNEEGVLNSWIERDLPQGPNPSLQQKFIKNLSHKWETHTKGKRPVVRTRGMEDRDWLEAEGEE